MARPVRVAIIGGGCAATTTAFELTRPEHNGRFEVTLFQQGWRLGGKGASGRGPADRVEEHGLHLWLGYYENAFRQLRECYSELDRNPATCRFVDWQDAIYPDRLVGLADRNPDGSWSSWVAHFPPVPGLPGDPLPDGLYTVRSYMVRTAQLAASLLASVSSDGHTPENTDEPASLSDLAATVGRVLRYGQLATWAALIEATRLLPALLEMLPGFPESLALRLIDAIGTAAQSQLETLRRKDAASRRVWEVLDLMLAALRGSVRFGLATDPRGFDAINDYEMREWLRLNGASESTLESAFVRGLYDLGFAYVDGDPQRPAIAAGVGLRGAVRMFYTYRGSPFWKMRAGMGDVIFAPLYEVLKKRGVHFKFFHRLRNVGLVPEEQLAPGEKTYVETLEFDVQARVSGGGDYQPLVEVRGLPCWPAAPRYDQLEDGDRLHGSEIDFESHWDSHRCGTLRLRVMEDFDFAVLGVSLGAVPHVCSEIVAHDRRWRAMVRNVKTVATQAMQLWLRESTKELGFAQAPINLSAYVKPFDTWADMSQLIPEESWPDEPRAIAYFCSSLATPPTDQEASSPQQHWREVVRQNAVQFLERDLGRLLPKSVDKEGFRWDLLVPPDGAALDRTVGSECVDGQFFTANVNPTDRYVLSVPGSPQHRISPLDNTYDNLTICGDWTDCGHNMGCVESAVMSGRLAAHALSGSPPLEEIIGYDHP